MGEGGEQLLENCHSNGILGSNRPGVVASDDCRILPCPPYKMVPETKLRFLGISSHLETPVLVGDLGQN